MKRNAFRLASLLSLALGLMGAGPGSCGTVPEPCEGLDEQTCQQTEGCEPVYFQPRCACAPCRPDMECPPCSCGVPDFASCGEERPEPPPAERCAGLDEPACVVEPGCAPVYFAAESGTRCESDRCIGGNAAYAGCVEAPVPPSCEGLEEAACLARPECEPVYGSDVALPCLEDCSGRCGGGFAGCRQVVCPAVACMLYCPSGLAVDERGCETCSCNPGCSSDGECAAGERCELPLFDCAPGYDCGVVSGRCVPAQQCLSDSECAGGEKCVVPEIDCPPGAYCSQALGHCAPSCDALDEAACAARFDCRGVWGSGCNESGCTPDRAFACEEAGAGCPDEICPLRCPNGFATDAQGCQTCACLPAGCVRDADCLQGEFCEISLTNCDPTGNCGPSEGVCRPSGCLNDSDCPSGMGCLVMPGFCDDGDYCESRGFCAPAGSCLGEADCGPGESCIFLMVGCLGEDCGPGYGTCSQVEPGCVSHADCAAGEICEFDVDACPPGAEGCTNTGFCRPAGCASDADCAPGQACEGAATCSAIGCPPSSPATCIDRACASDADCAQGTVCRADPKDPCSQSQETCFAPARQICQAPCAGLDEAACTSRPDCSATYTSGGWCGNDMAFASCADR